MQQPPKIKRFTYADYCVWPDYENWELIDGTLFTKTPSPSFAHQSILLELAVQLKDFLDGTQCRVFVAPFDVRLNAAGEDDTVVQPDILVVCDKTKLANGKSVAGVPELIIEILSPFTGDYERITKRDLYERKGVPEYWIVDPEKKTLTTFILGDDAAYFACTYDHEATAVPVEVLEGCEINIAVAFVAAEAF